MATRKPLVIVSGQVQQLQAGDTIDSPISGAQEITATNKEVGAIVIGAPAYVFGNNEVKKAKADASGTKDVIGLVKTTSIAADASGVIAVDGVLTATTGQWDAVTGGAGGLTAGTKYYLDPATAGMLTATPPSAAGQYVCPIGKALSTTEMMIDIEETVLL